MALTIAEPIVVPQKSFDKYWACSINISAPGPSSEVTAQVLLLPYSSTTGETYPEGILPLNITSIMEKCNADANGNFAKALFFLLAAIDEEKLSQDAPNEE